MEFDDLIDKNDRDDAEIEQEDPCGQCGRCSHQWQQKSLTLSSAWHGTASAHNLEHFVLDGYLNEHDINLVLYDVDGDLSILFLVLLSSSSSETSSVSTISSLSSINSSTYSESTVITNSGWSMVRHISNLAVLKPSPHLFVEIVASLDVLLPHHLLHPPRVEGGDLL